MDFFEEEVDELEKFYRAKIADDIDACLFNGIYNDSTEVLQSHWFNEGMRYASMIARFGLM